MKIGHRMQQAIEYVKTHPNCCKKHVAEWITPCRRPEQNWAYGYNPVNRAIAAGLINCEWKNGKSLLTLTKLGEQHA